VAERALRWARVGELAGGLAIGAPLGGWTCLLATSAVERAIGTGAPAMLAFFALGALGGLAWVGACGAVVASRLASPDRRWPARAAILAALAPASWLACWAAAAAWASAAVLSGPWDFFGAVH
jgi:hypothetical protein